MYVPYNFTPSGWHECDGALLPINENEALFSLLGTTYCADGQTTFVLPNAQGRVIIDEGQGSGLFPYFMRENGGQRHQLYFHLKYQFIVTK